jgi:hypothetical protein
VKVNGAVQVGAGVLLATGKMPRVAALALIGSIVPTTYAGHRFWEETDDVRRKQQWIHFLKNLGLLGGLLLELDSRPKKRRGGRRHSADTVRSSSKKIVGRAKRLEAKAKRVEIRAERRARQAASEASKFAARTAADVTESSKKAAKRSHDLAGQYAQSASQYAQSASDQAGHLVSYAQDHVSNLKVA